MTFSIKPRAAWGARPPRRPPAHIATPTPELWIHHTATEQHGASGVRAIQTYHMDTKGWNDIAYSFLVDDDGVIFEGRGFGIQGGHTANRNSISHAICLLGNFQNRPPTDAALAAANWLYHEGRRLNQWGNVTGGHRQAPGASTACPGNHLQARLAAISASPQPSTPTSEVCEVQLPVLVQGSPNKGAVRSLQALLIEKAGQNLGTSGPGRDGVDGNFGPATDRAVRNVEAFFGLTVNGIVGPDTWGVLFL